VPKRVPSEKVNGKRVIKRYLGGLKGTKRKARAKEIVKRREQARAGNPDYSPFKTDKKVKTSPSKYTIAYKKRYGGRNATKK
jgi:hypothetical protein